jgi:hypothetical protein
MRRPGTLICWSSLESPTPFVSLMGGATELLLHRQNAQAQVVSLVFPNNSTFVHFVFSKNKWGKGWTGGKRKGNFFAAFLKWVGGSHIKGGGGRQGEGGSNNNQIRTHCTFGRMPSSSSVPHPTPARVLPKKRENQSKIGQNSVF